MVTGVAEGVIVLEGAAIGEEDRLADSVVSPGDSKSCCEPAGGEDKAIAWEELKAGSRVQPVSTPAPMSNTPAAKKIIDFLAIDSPDISSSMA